MFKLLMIPALFASFAMTNVNAVECIKRYDMETVSLCLTEVEPGETPYEHELSFDLKYNVPFENLWFVGVSSEFVLDDKTHTIWSKLFVQSEPSERELDARVWYYPDGRGSKKAKILVNYSKGKDVRNYAFEEELEIDIGDILQKNHW